MKKLYILITIICFTLISGCYFQYKNKNQFIENIQATMEVNFELKLYDRIEFHPDIQSQIQQYKTLENLGYNCLQEDFNGFGDYSCYSITGYQGKYFVPEWNIKLEENNGCIFAESFVLKSKRSPAFYLIGDRIYSRPVDQNIEDRTNYIYTGEKLYINMNEEYIQYGLNNGLNYQNIISSYMQNISGTSYNLIDCKHLENTVTNKISNICYQIEGTYLYFIFNENYNFHYIYNLYGEGAPCKNGVFEKVEFFAE